MPAIVWLPWSAVSFARARTERKPVLLSIAPTWCRNSVEMDRSSFADPDVVARVGLRYVPIRVDADRRPDICERYSLGGWPTTAFLTPDGGLLGGGTYVEHERLADVLERVADAFHKRGHATVADTTPRARAARPPGLTAEQLLEQIDGYYDPEHGGFGGAPKFPHVAPVHLALARYRQQQSATHRDMAIRTLDAMGWGPLHDDRDGGFFRYSRSGDWTSPPR